MEIAPVWTAPVRQHERNLLAIWGSAGGKLWSKQRRRTIAKLRQRDLDDCRPTGPLTSYATWGSDTSSNVWFWAPGKHRQWNGYSLSSQVSPTREGLSELWGTDSHVWAVGSTGTILKWDGTNWTAQMTAPPSFAGRLGC